MVNIFKILSIMKKIHKGKIQPKGSTLSLSSLFSLSYEILENITARLDCVQNMFVSDASNQLRNQAIAKVLFSAFKCPEFLEIIISLFEIGCSVANMRPLTGETSHCKGSAEIAPCSHIFLQHFKIRISCTYYN